MKSYYLQFLSLFYSDLFYISIQFPERADKATFVGAPYEWWVDTQEGLEEGRLVGVVRSTHTDTQAVQYSLRHNYNTPGGSQAFYFNFFGVSLCVKSYLVVHIIAFFKLDFYIFNIFLLFFHSLRCTLL
jgi:hypothetical protein